MHAELIKCRNPSHPQQQVLIKSRLRRAKSVFFPLLIARKIRTANQAKLTTDNPLPGVTEPVGQLGTVDIDMPIVISTPSGGVSTLPTYTSHCMMEDIDMSEDEGGGEALADSHIYLGSDGKDLQDQVYTSNNDQPCVRKKMS